MYIHTYIMIRNKVKFFKALGDGSRLKVLQCLLGRDFCACDFTSKTKRDQTTISRHLKVLVEAGILKYERRGRNIIYSIKNDEVRKILTDFGIKSCCREVKKNEK